MDELGFIVFFMIMVCVLVIAWFWFAYRALRVITEASQKNSETIAATLNRTTIALAQVKGLHPHHADKDTFAPSGIAYTAAEVIGAKVRDSREAAHKAKRVEEYRIAIEALKGRGNEERAQQLKTELALILEEEPA